MYSSGAAAPADENQRCSSIFFVFVRLNPKKSRCFQASRVVTLRYYGSLRERQYALRRALMIRSYLTQKGTHSLRIEMRPSGQKGAGEKIPDRTDILLEER